MALGIRWLWLAAALTACDRPGLLPEGPLLQVSASSLVFEAPGGYDPAPRELSVRNGAGRGSVIGGLSVDYGGGAQGWLSVAWTDPAVSPVTVTVRPQTSQLASGTHRATLRIAAAGAANSPAAVPVEVVVAPPRPASSVPYLSIAAPPDGSDPAPVVFLVSNGGGGILPRPTLSLDDGTGQAPAWVQASVSGDAEPYRVTVQASDPHSDALFFSGMLRLATGKESTDVFIGFGPALARAALSREKMVFSFQPGGLDPAPQTVQVFNAGGRALPVPTVAVPSTDSWLTASVSGSAAPYTVSVALVPSVVRGLSPGSYLSSVAVDSVGTRYLLVWLEVGSPPAIAWASSPRSLSFRALAGDIDPAPQSLRVETVAGAALGAPSVQVEALGGGAVPWLSATLSGAVSPFQLQVQPHVAGLAPGYYSAQVSISSPAPSLAEVVRVDLSVPGWDWLSTAPCAATATATVLGDGRVLVTGRPGPPARSVQLCASLFSPAEGRWSDTVVPPAVRAEHSATLLGDGRVLVAAGLELPTGVESGGWEVYDPATGLWLTGPVRLAPRRRHVAALLPDGRVLVAGGWSSGGARSGAELLDPATGLVAPAPPLQAARAGAAAVVLADGRVLVAGGATTSGAPLASAEIFDPESGTWSGAGAMGAARIAPALVLLGNGKVLAAGGSDAKGPLASAEILDPAAGTWAPTGTMSSPRATGGLALADGRVLLAGGAGDPAAPGSSTAESYDPAAGTWSSIAALPGAFPGGHSLSLLPDGRVLLTGGCRSSDCSAPIAGALIGRGVAP